MKWSLHAWILGEQLCCIAGSRSIAVVRAPFRSERYARERQVLERRLATGGLRHDVVHVERGFLADIAIRQYSHRSLARSRTRRCNETGMCPVLIPALGGFSTNAGAAASTDRPDRPALPPLLAHPR
jgi:hypothetical protein